jgi:hypothetical protein
MRPRLLAAGWVLVAALFVILALYGLSKWYSLSTEMARVRAERERLTSEIELRQQQLVAEMRRHAELLQEMQWTSSGADPATFLARLAELAREKRMKVMAIGPLEQQSSPQFNKSWHTIQIQAPYREIRELALRVEGEKGILEDVHLEAAAQTGGPPAAAAPRDEIQARFKMTALELSPQAKMIIERALASTRGTAQVPPGSPLALSVPSRETKGSAGRDPFFFLTPPPIVRAGGGPSAPGPEVAGAPPGPVVPLDVKGIVSFPDGFLAIVNNQIVKVGDTVSGHRVERITDNAVSLREPGAAPRTIQLPELGATPPAPPRR